MVAGLEEVGVDGEGGCSVGVTESSAHGSDGNACGEESGGGKVAEVVQADVVVAEGIPRCLEPLGDGRWRPGDTAVRLGGEHEG